MARPVTRAAVVRSGRPLRNLQKRHSAAKRPCRPQQVARPRRGQTRRLGYDHGPHCRGCARAWPKQGLLLTRESARDSRSSVHVLEEHPTPQEHGKRSAPRTRRARPYREASQKRLAQLSVEKSSVLSALSSITRRFSPSCSIPPRGIES